MTLARGRVAEGHPIAAADLRIELMHRAGEAVGWKPFGQCVRLEERAIDLIWPSGQHAVQMNRIGHDVFSLWLPGSNKSSRVRRLSYDDRKKRLGLMLSGRRLLAVDHPWSAELVDQHAKPTRKIPGVGASEFTVCH